MRMIGTMVKSVEEETEMEMEIVEGLWRAVPFEHDYVLFV